MPASTPAPLDDARAATGTDGDPAVPPPTVSVLGVPLALTDYYFSWKDSDGAGKRSHAAIGGEIRVPVLEFVTLNGAGRYDRFGFAGRNVGKFTYNGGVEVRPTTSLLLRAAYGTSYVHFNRLGGENLLSFNGPHVVPITITQQPSQGLCAPNQAPTTCFRPTQAGYPEGLNVPANFNPINGRVNYIPPDTRTGSIQSWHVTFQRELGNQPSLGMR